MTGVSGVRGIVGEGITPEVILHYAAVFASTLKPGPVVVGRDSRPSGEMLHHALVAGLLGAGREVLEIGIVPTPTVQLEVERQKAAGGIALTASHNPIQWNALKFIAETGRFLGLEDVRSFLAKAEGPASFAKWDSVGKSRKIHDAIEHHVDLILELAEVNPAKIKASRLRVVLDAVHGAGGKIGRELLERLGTDVTVLFEEPTGQFPRPPEPMAENLDRLGEEVKKQGADLGLAFDPDVDRLSLVDETGKPLGEEYTLPLAADHVLGSHPGVVVTNLSTSARIEAVAKRHGQAVVRTPVGEANVVQGILEHSAIIGGEGNGGVILPALHLGRDAPAGAALILSGLAERGVSLSRWVGELPDLAMIKIKLPVSGEPDLKRVRSVLARVLETPEEDFRDGIRMSGAGEWVHLRKSATEPIIRIIAEAQNQERAQFLANTVKKALG